MSQLSQLLEGKISLGQFVSDVEGDVKSVVSKLENADPAVASAVGALGAAATAVAEDGVTWAETALAGVAANLTADIEAAAMKYLPQVLGAAPAGAAVTAGAVTLAQEFGALLQQAARAAASLALQAL